MAPEMTTLKGKPLDRQAVDSLLRRRFFYAPSADIYGPTAGFFDYGPPGCALQTNIVDIWRKHFILEEDMLEIDSPIITIAPVLKSSGHVERFCDSVVKDPSNGDILRADHVLEEVLEARLKGDKEARGEKVEAVAADPKKKRKAKVAVKAVQLDDATVKAYTETLAKIDNYDAAGLSELFEMYDIRNPSSGNKFNLPVYPQNLMFAVSIGSTQQPGYLRPETAQSQFLNFNKLLEFNGRGPPFASASIGKAGRNEISPKAGLIRVREFLMAEIEHYVDPDGAKDHPRFHEVAHVSLPLLDNDTQLSGSTEVAQTEIGEAVKAGKVANSTLGYFLARIQLFLLKLGFDPSKVRYRQHMANEMAHYAQDCWDTEILTSYGWIECVGCADRSCFDLTQHGKVTGVPLVVRELRSTPLTIKEWVAETQKANFGPRFKKDSKTIQSTIEQLAQDVKERLSVELKENGKITIDVPGVGDGKVELTPDFINISEQTRIEHTREYIPNVIEPSFGIGRLLYALCEHVQWTREEAEERAVLSFPLAVAPTKCLLVPLSSNDDFKPLISALTRTLRAQGISTRVDDSGASIGKRYSRNDELGTPLGITVDFQSLKDGTVTLRDRDTTIQVRADQVKIVEAVVRLINGTETWDQTLARLPKFEGQELA